MRVFLFLFANSNRVRHKTRMLFPSSFFPKFGSVFAPNPISESETCADFFPNLGKNVSWAASLILYDILGVKQNKIIVNFYEFFYYFFYLGQNYLLSFNVKNNCYFNCKLITIKNKNQITN